MQNIREMIIYVSINDNLFILYFHLNLDAKFEQYREHYAQIHEIVSNESNLAKSINYAINRFLNICVNRSILRKSTLVMIVIIFVLNSFLDKVQSDALSKIKNVVIIIVKNVYYLRKEISHDERASRAVQSQARSRSIRWRTRRSKQQTQTKKRQRRRRKIQFEDRWRRKKHKIYIVINFEILTIMSVMSRHVAYWVLNTICFQHNVRNKSTFIFYTIFSRFIFVNDLKSLMIAMK
jgi:hypothetical protein